MAHSQVHDLGDQARVKEYGASSPARSAFARPRTLVPSPVCSSSSTSPLTESPFEKGLATQAIGHARLPRPYSLCWSDLLKRALRSHEEEHSSVQVYRPEDYPFPP